MIPEHSDVSLNGNDTWGESEKAHVYGRHDSLMILEERQLQQKPLQGLARALAAGFPLGACGGKLYRC